MLLWLAADRCTFDTHMPVKLRRNSWLNAAEINTVKQKSLSDMIINNDKWVMNEENQDFAAREIYKWCEGTCPCLMFIYFYLFFCIFSVLGKRSQWRITNLHPDSSQSAMKEQNIFFIFWVLFHTKHQEAFFWLQWVYHRQPLHMNPIKLFREPVFSNERRGICVTLCQIVLSVAFVFVVGRFLYSSQGWNREVTWKHLYLLLFFQLILVLIERKWTSGCLSLKPWCSYLLPFSSFWGILLNKAGFHILCDAFSFLGETANSVGNLGL